MLALVAIVLLANLPYLAGITDPNPLGPRSQIATAQPGILSGANTLDPTDGYITQALGHQAAVDILHGHLPLWNPYEGVGMPLLGEGQSAALFPPTLLLALDNGQFWEDLLLELVAGLATFLVLRRVGVGRVAAVAGGAAFALNGAFAWLATTSFNPVAFLPLTVLGIEQARAASLAGRRGGWWLIAVALALSIYAGFPETAYIDGLVVLLWFAWRALGRDRPPARSFIGKGLAGALAGLLLAAPFLVAFLGALPHEFVGFHNGNASVLRMPHFAFPQLWLPYVYGPPLAFDDPANRLGTVWGYAGGFVPVSLVLLAALSLLARRRRGLSLVLWGWTILALAAVYGQPPVLRDVLGWLPGGTSVAFYRYSFPAVSFALAVMAASGIDQVVAAAGRRARIIAVSGGMLALTAVLALDAHRLVVQLNGGSGHSRWAWAQIGWAAAVVVAIGSLALLRGRRFARAVAVILVIDACAMFSLHEFSAPRAVRMDPAPVAYLQRHLGAQRFFTLGPIAPNYGGYWRLASLNDIDLPLPARWTAYVTRRLDPYVNPVFFVGNAGGGRSPSVPTPEHELLAHLGAYRNAGVAYVVTLPGTAIPSGHGSFRLVRRTPTAWIFKLDGASSYFSTRSPCAVRLDGRQAADLSCPRPTVLVRRELAFPGWSAQVDGRSVPIRAAGGVYQSIRVPAGRSRATFSYTPPHFDLALAGFLGGGIWILCSLAGVRRGRGAPRLALRRRRLAGSR